jgi:hypothetical protein
MPSESSDRKWSPAHGGEAAGSRGKARRVEGLGRNGLLIVGTATLVLTLNQTTKFLVTVPFAEWLAIFLHDVAWNAAVGVAMLCAVVWTRNRHPQPGPRQYVSAFAAVAGAAYLAMGALEFWDGAVTGLADMLLLVPELVRYVLLGMVVTGAWLYTCTEADHAAAIEECAVDSARMDEQAAEARLQILEAQIEPHFLFNTLAHVRRLYESDRAAGARMLRNLEAYLAVALPQMRAGDSTLGRELDHVSAYLDIQQIRMGRRLAYGIAVDDALRDARLPPLMVLTLVENAIKHGLTPLPAGGRIDIRAAVDAGRLRVEVADTGQGFTRSGGAGVGLANIRARLAAQFGEDASLALALNSPCGVVATILLPCLPAAAKAVAS